MTVRLPDQITAHMKEVGREAAEHTSIIFVSTRLRHKRTTQEARSYFGRFHEFEEYRLTPITAAHDVRYYNPAHLQSVFQAWSAEELTAALRHLLNIHPPFPAGIANVDNAAWAAKAQGNYPLYKAWQLWGAEKTLIESEIQRRKPAQKG